MTWFRPDELDALKDFWSVYEARYDEVQRSTTIRAESIPAFRAILAAMPPEQLAAQQAESLEMLRRAVAGDWPTYAAQLRQQGGMYAALGVELAAWYELVAAFAHDLVPHLVERFSAEPARLTGALLALHTFLDRVMSELAQAYLDAKQALLSASERKLATTLDSIGDAVIATDAAGVTVRLNRVAERLTGWTASEAIGRPLGEVFRIEHEETGEPVESPVDRVIREGVVVGLANHTALVARDETRIPIADSGAPIFGEDGKIDGVVLVFRDQSEEREAQRALRRSQQRFDRLCEAGVVGIVVGDIGGPLLEANEAFLQLTGRTRADLEDGQLTMAAITPPEWHSADAEAARVLLKTGVVAPQEKEFLRRDGTRVPVLVGSALLESSSRISLVLDLSERKRFELARARSAELEAENRRVQEANRLKSEFLANMSHELRTPLNSIIGFTELLHDGEVGPIDAKQKEFLGDILASSHHLLQLINDVLDLSKVEAGKMDFHPEEVDLESLIDEVRRVLNIPATQKRIDVSTHVSPGSGHVVADPARLKQVLYNYLSNALKFTPEGGHVVVRVLPEHDGGFRFEIEDDGIGIAQHEIDRLFVEFQQLDAGASKHHQGTGLGLALTRRLVEAQGGHVGVRSTLGRGSIFWASLPRSVASSSPLPPPRSIPSPAKGAPRVLVVEDEAHDQETIVAILAAAGYSIDTASTAAQALARCREHRYDAITLDILLPDGNGLDVLRAVRAETPNRDVPVIAITIVSAEAVAGYVVHDVLAKPVEQRALLGALERAGVSPDSTSAVWVIDDDQPSLRLMAATLEQLGHRALCFDDATAALAACEHTTPLAIVLDLLMPTMDGFRFLQCFREREENKRTPVMVWTAKDLSGEDRRVLDAMTAGVLPKGGGGGSALLTAIAAHLPAPTHEEE